MGSKKNKEKLFLLIRNLLSFPSILFSYSYFIAFFLAAQVIGQDSEHFSIQKCSFSIKTFELLFIGKRNNLVARKKQLTTFERAQNSVLLKKIHSQKVSTQSQNVLKFDQF